MPRRAYPSDLSDAEWAVPHEYPPWQAVSHDFSQWRIAGVWDQITTELRTQVRQRSGRSVAPTAGVRDRQSVRSTGKGGHGYDGAKRLTGRKRQIPCPRESRYCRADGWWHGPLPGWVGIGGSATTMSNCQRRESPGSRSQ